MVWTVIPALIAVIILPALVAAAMVMLMVVITVMVMMVVAVMAADAQRTPRGPVPFRQGPTVTRTGAWRQEIACSPWYTCRERRPRAAGSLLWRGPGHKRQ